MIIVRDENIERALIEFRKASGPILSEFKRRQYFETKIERRKNKDSLALKRKKNKESERKNYKTS